MKFEENQLNQLLNENFQSADIIRLLGKRKSAFIQWASMQEFENDDIVDIWLAFERVNPRFPSKKLREIILAKYEYTCQACGRTDQLCVDHIIPYSKGGWTNEENLTVLCKKCNSIKKDKL